MGISENESDCSNQYTLLLLHQSSLNLCPRGLLDVIKTTHTLKTKKKAGLAKWTHGSAHRNPRKRALGWMESMEKRAGNEARGEEEDIKNLWRIWTSWEEERGKRLERSPSSSDCFLHPSGFRRHESWSLIAYCFDGRQDSEGSPSSSIHTRYTRLILFWARSRTARVFFPRFNWKPNKNNIHWSRSHLRAKTEHGMVSYGRWRDRFHPRRSFFFFSSFSNEKWKQCVRRPWVYMHSLVQKHLVGDASIDASPPGLYTQEKKTGALRSRSGFHCGSRAHLSRNWLVTLEGVLQMRDSKKTWGAWIAKTTNIGPAS